MQKNGAIYKYNAIYVDHLAIAAKDAKETVRMLKEKHGFKVKGERPFDYHLGMQFARNPEGTLYQSSDKYIALIFQNYEHVF